MNTKRTLSPQWNGKSLGDFTVITNDVTPENIVSLLNTHASAMIEFLSGAAHIKVSGSATVREIRARLEEKHGAPEKGKTAAWLDAHRVEAQNLATELLARPINFDAELREWCNAWKAETASTENLIAKAKALSPEEKAALIKALSA